MRILFIALVPLALAGCQSVNSWARSKMTTFEPVGGGVYAYSIIAHGESGETLGNEEDRINHLEQYLAENNLCKAGYIIDSRVPIKTGEMIRGSEFKVHYRVRCR